MLTLKVAQWFMGEVVKKIALALKIIKKGSFAYEPEVERPFKSLAGTCGEKVIAEVKKSPEAGADSLSAS